MELSRFNLRRAEKAAQERVGLNQWGIEALQERLEEGRAALAYRAWKQDESLGRPYHQVRKQKCRRINVK